MSYSNIPAGKDAPNDIYVIIEISVNAAPIKYEIDKDSDALFVDRFMGTAMFYPANYGYVPNTLSEDGDPLDVLVVTPHPFFPLSFCLVYSSTWLAYSPIAALYAFIFNKNINYF